MTSNVKQDPALAQFRTMRYGLSHLAEDKNVASALVPSETSFITLPYVLFSGCEFPF